MERLAPAPYGQACINCAKTKCRCILRGKDLSCERYDHVFLYLAFITQV